METYTETYLQAAKNVLQSISNRTGKQALLYWDGKQLRSADKPVKSNCKWNFIETIELEKQRTIEQYLPQFNIN